MMKVEELRDEVTDTNIDKPYRLDYTVKVVDEDMGNYKTYDVSNLSWDNENDYFVINIVREK